MEIITEEKVIKETFEATLARLNLAMYAAQMGAGEWDIKTGKMEWDGRAHNLFGYSSGNILRNIEIFNRAIFHEDREQASRQIDEAIEDKTDFNTEFRVLWPDGTLHWIQSIGRIFYDLLGSPGRVIGVVLDITKRKQEEEALQYTKAKFESLVNAIPQIVWISEPDGTGSYYNHQWYDYSGIPAGSIRSDLNQGTVHPDDFSVADAAWNKAVLDNQAFEMEIRIRRYDGVYRWFLAKAVPLKDSTGKLLKWFGTSTDIHSSKTAELRALALQVLSASLLKARSLQDVAKAIVAEGGKALGASSVTVIWKNTATKVLEILATDEFESDLVKNFKKIDSFLQNPVVQCIEKQEAIYVSSPREWIEKYSGVFMSKQYQAWDFFWK